ncbi:preprotein translocase subunit SecY [Candidatus Gracilibacteria bacterium]|nr:preprotein translocase subunit SecY [Candidatus Gracilibacteria bacterium]
MRDKTLKTIQSVFKNKYIVDKIVFTLIILAIYRLLVFLPVPFVDIHALMGRTLDAGAAGGLGYFVMLLGGALDSFSIIAIGLAPYINASIIMQLMGSVIPKLEELTEQGEAGQMKIQQYTRYLTLPLAFLQGIGMVYFINYLLGSTVIQTSLINVLLSAFVMTVGAIMLMRLGELITEKGVSNGVSLLIFASIVAGMTQQIYSDVSGSSSFWGVIVFMLVIVLVLILFSIFILKSMKEIPVVYARRGKVEQTSTLPIPMNPVGMIPIIFAIAFVSFPYLLSKMIVQFQPMNAKLVGFSTWIESNLNIYSQQPGAWAILFYFILIVAFTFFYTLITFSPDKISDNIQKRGGFVPGIRPGKETAKYLNGILMHLCLWGGVGLALIGSYSYLISYVPFIQDLVQSIGSLPVVVTGSGVIIIVGVVQDIINKVQADLLMQKYEKFDLDAVGENLKGI